MPKLFSNQNKKFLKVLDKPESFLNKFICENWNSLFPKLIFVTNEFQIKGNVRSIGTDGRIDILSYNPETKRFVIFELKKEFSRNITDQAADYRDFIQDNFSDIYLKSFQKYKIQLPEYSEIAENQVEIVLIAKKFSNTHIERVGKNKDNTITLIKYFWFEDDLIFIDYINNDPDEIKKISVSDKKLKDIGIIATQEPDIYEIDRFFNTKNEAKTLFTKFYNYLKTKDNVILKPKALVITVKIKDISFSSVGYSGKVGKKSILLIQTNFEEITKLKSLEIVDRINSEGKKKGAWGAERFIVYIKNEKDIDLLIEFFNERL